MQKLQPWDGQARRRDSGVSDMQFTFGEAGCLRGFRALLALVELLGTMKTAREKGSGRGCTLHMPVGGSPLEALAACFPRFLI